jgi:succinate dehydrogenase / fumarate reductase flavoprotein subunit
MSSPVVSERGRVRRVLVVGSGISGLMTALRLCERGIPVQVLSAGGAGQAGSAALRGGIAASGLGPNDDAVQHLRDTLVAGEFLQHQPPVMAMCERSSAIVDRLMALGVCFARDARGLETLQSPGSSRARSAEVRGGLGRQVLNALLTALRRHEAVDVTDGRGASIPGERRLVWLEHHEFLSLVADDNSVVVGAAIQDRRTLKVRSVTADAVCLATGGATSLFARATTGLGQTGAAIGRAMRQGAVLANPEFVQYCTIAIPGPTQAHALPSSVLGLGGRLWVPRDAEDARRPADIPERERNYLLERYDSELGNLMQADQACRVIVRWLRLGNALLDAQSLERVRGVYLDTAHLPDSTQQALAGEYELYRRFTGSNSWRDPMVVEPAAHATLGGLWVDYEADGAGALVEDSPRNQATSVAGLYAVGDAACQFHGAARLDDNAALACLFSGSLAASAIGAYRLSLSKSPYDLPSSIFERAAEREENAYTSLFGEGTGETPRGLMREVGELMLEHCGIERDDAGLEGAQMKLAEIVERAARARATGSSSAAHTAALTLRDVRDATIVAQATVLAARARIESRGSHFKFGAASRDDVSWLRTSLVAFDGLTPQLTSEVSYASAGREIRRDDSVDTRFIPPEPRRRGSRSEKP